MTWPGLTSKNVQKYLAKSEFTAMGHLDQKRQNVKSTKLEKIRGLNPVPPTRRTPKKNAVVAGTVPAEPTGKKSWIRQGSLL